MTAGRIDQAVEAYGLATELLPRVADRHLGRADAEHWLTRFAGVANDAAACAVEVGNPDRAIALLELGRGVLLTQALEARSDFTDLLKHDRKLADRFHWLCSELEEQHDTSRLRTDTEIAAASRAADRRHDLADELDMVIARIREFPGLQRFLLPPTVSEIVAQTSDGPIALINISQYRCDALLLRAQGVHVVSLPGLSLDAVRKRTETFLTALDVIHEPHQTSTERSQAEKSIREILGWLWDTVTEPVLNELGLHATPGPKEPWPRIWWIPTGLLGLLPLHAAGYHETHNLHERRAVIDRVVSSYTPTMRALAHSRSKRTTAGCAPRTLCSRSTEHTECCGSARRPTGSRVA